MIQKDKKKYQNPKIKQNSKLTLNFLARFSNG